MKFVLVMLALLSPALSSAESCDKSQKEIKAEFLAVYSTASMTRVAMEMTDKASNCFLLGNLEGQIRQLMNERSIIKVMTDQQSRDLGTIWQNILQAGAFCGLKGRAPGEAQTKEEMMVRIQAIEIMARNIGQSMTP